MKVEFNDAMNHILKNKLFDLYKHKEVNIDNINRRFILNPKLYDIRVDEVFLWSKYDINIYLIVSYIIASQYLTKSVINKSIKNPIVLIQYDNWDDDVPEWFFVKIFSENHYKIYLWDWWINWTKTPYIKISLS